ncbi:MAG TPA: isoprenylcysteine carboxylmethyltransferase family protein [Acidobacteriaceae bacterium]|nr:isoprenylcysteine carboxylmethyltransferase family protein [Acidobacteriaceae bacterium]
MKASALEFRFRLILMTLAIVLGFWSPWIEWLHWGSRTTAWLWLGFELGGLGISSTRAIELATVLIIAAAAVGAWFRVWGTAYLGTATVHNAEMKAGLVMADGPYRHVRNPLYIGSWLMVAAISMLMPPTGALFTMIVLTVFLFRLILGEEAFLAGRLGEPYLAYRKAVPRLLPSLRARVAPAGQKPDWGRGLLSEVMPLGAMVSFAALSWQYDSRLLTRAMLVSFGLSLVVRALVLPRGETPSAAE